MNYFIIEYISEIVDANTKEEAIEITNIVSKTELSKLIKKTLAKLKMKIC